MRHPKTLIAIALLATPLAGCASDGDWVELKGVRIAVEIADEHAERQRGLMFRDRLERGTGMVFVHEREQPLAYWMKNTRIPLDILYFDAQRRLVSVSNAPPCSAERCPPYPARGPAMYVLELNAGEAESLGLVPGDTLTLGPGVPERGAP
ncbi:DUF192 domain-containing protein [Arenimonas composti]|uniref:ACR family protein n=1 Tax=Arenimonas composti TR7-09 = DSM 18010 TaxID=1121013 RepID=A0A091BE91_9GAMM|nr:DUF192 domain-containing protein [Arenimonas composti]KFN49139.1 hypothetical protein P873_11840 [Arenimonas composti TR7-09 = DSM 18010]